MGMSVALPHRFLWRCNGNHPCKALGAPGPCEFSTNSSYSYWAELPQAKTWPPWRRPPTLTVGLGAETRRTGSMETTNLEVLSIYLILLLNIPTILEKKATSFLYYLTPLWQIPRTFLFVVILWHSIFSFLEFCFPSWLLELLPKHFFLNNTWTKNQHTR